MLQRNARTWFDRGLSSVCSSEDEIVRIWRRCCSPGRYPSDLLCAQITCLDHHSSQKLTRLPQAFESALARETVWVVIEVFLEEQQDIRKSTTSSHLSYAH